MSTFAPQELVWIDGHVQPLAGATVPLEDRANQFADGVYEVIRIYDGVPFTLDEHLARLARSADGIRLGALPMPADDIAAEIRSLVARSGIAEGMVYLQLSRGVAPRNHVIPAGLRPSLYFFVRPLPPLPPAGTGPGARLMTVPDERWKRCWVKSVALLPNVLAKNAAVDAGYDEAVFVDDDLVTECSASNVYAILGRTIITAPIGPRVLPGVTRALVAELAAAAGLAWEDRSPTVAECRRADELFITSTTREVHWVSQWDDLALRPGPRTTALAIAYQQRVRAAVASAARSAELAAV